LINAFVRLARGDISAPSEFSTRAPVRRDNESIANIPPPPLAGKKKEEKGRECTPGGAFNLAAAMVNRVRDFRD
jgi:hypothetical protein